MSQEELLERIKTLETSTIERMSFEGIAMLTDKFKEPLVKEVIIRGKTNDQQRKLFSVIKNGYREWMKDTNIMWGAMKALEKYPDYLNYILFNLECDFILTKKGWEKEQRATLEISPVTNFVQAYESALRNYNATANNEKTVEEKTDIKQVEELCTNEEDNNDADEIDDENDAEEIDDENDEEEIDDEHEDEDEEEAPIIFKDKIDEDEVIKKIKSLSSDKVDGIRRWYVFFRVFDYLEWLDKSVTQPLFISWVEHHFGWKWKTEDFKSCPFAKIPPCDWCSAVNKYRRTKGEKMIVNKELGPNYYEFADDIVRTFVSIDNEGGMHDKDDFLIAPSRGGIAHKNIWK